ncbi:MAG: hypothetical protein ACRDQ5_27290 [Sciscionella sp.]
MRAFFAFFLACSAPILHLCKQPGSNLFDTYLRSFELVWNEESYKDAPPATS